MHGDLESIEVATMNNKESSSGEESDMEWYHPKLSENELSGSEWQLWQNSTRGRRAAKGSKSSRCAVKNDGYEIYPITVAYKIYKSVLEQSHCKRIGDGF